MLCVNEMKKWQSIQDLISILEAEKEEIEARLAALKRALNSFNDEVIFKYIETWSTVEAAEYVKSKCRRLSRGTVYAASDVSALIQEGGWDINGVLLRIAREIFSKNSKAAERAYG